MGIEDNEPEIRTKRVQQEQDVKTNSSDGYEAKQPNNLGTNPTSEKTSQHAETEDLR
jgi:hypothetical protein